MAKMALIVSALLAKGPHDGDTKNSPVVAFEETGARKSLAHNTLRSTCLFITAKACWPPSKSIHHQRPENIVTVQSSNRNTILLNLSRFSSRTTILIATVDKLRKCHRNISEQGPGSKFYQDAVEYQEKPPWAQTSHIIQLPQIFQPKFAQVTYGGDYRRRWQVME